VLTKDVERTFESHDVSGLISTFEVFLLRRADDEA